MESLRRIACFLAVAALACATVGPRPGTGDVSFRLTWEGQADLDLYVVSPLGEHVNFHIRRVPSEGWLDVDCNVRQEEEILLCPQPIENIYWPRGRAPHGTFKYWAVLALTDEAVPTEEYLLQVRIGRQLVREHTGRVADLRDHSVIYEIELPGEDG